MQLDQLGFGSVSNVLAVRRAAVRVPVELLRVSSCLSEDFDYVRTLQGICRCMLGM